MILVRRETSPADIAGMAAARGILTSLGGLVSHAAVVARGWGVPAVVGAGVVEVADDGITIAGRNYPNGTEITVDGDNGTVLLGNHVAEIGKLRFAIKTFAKQSAIGIRRRLVRIVPTALAFEVHHRIRRVS